MNDRHCVPTITMHPVKFEDGSFGVELIVTGLADEQQAETAMLHMQQVLCGQEIKVQ